MAEKKIVTLAGERNVKALADRLIKEGAVEAPANRAAFEKQLLAVNPHLAEIGKLPQGTPVVVPKAPVLPATPAEANPMIHAAMDRARKVLADGEAILAAAAEAEKARLAAMDSPAARKVLADLQLRDPDLAKSLSTLRDAAKASAVKIDAAATVRSEAVREISRRLGAKIDPIR
jgi:hypothetical protein